MGLTDRHVLGPVGEADAGGSAGVDLTRPGLPPVTPARFLRRIPPIYWAFLGLVVVLGVVSPRSIEPVHLLDLARQGAPLGLVALGQTIVIMAGGFDLSVGSTVVLVDVLAAQVINGNEALVLPITAMLLIIGAGIGLANGVIVTRFGVPSIIATLGMSLVVYGIALVVSGGSPSGSIPPGMQFWGNGSVAAILPAAGMVWLATTVLVWLLVRRTVLGRELVVVGASNRAAHAAGISVPRTVAASYVLSGVLAAAGGWLLVAYIGTATLEIGTDYILDSIAAAVIGGAVLTGGRGSAWGTAGATLFLMTLFSILTLVALPFSGRWTTHFRALPETCWSPPGYVS